MSFPPPSPRQARIIWFALTGLALAAIVALIVALVWGVGRVLHIISPVLWPLAVAGVLAYLLDPVVDWLHRKWMSRQAAILSVFAFALLLLALLLASVIPQLVNETQDLAQRIPGYVQRAEQRLDNYLNNPPQWARRFLEPPGSKANLPPIIEPPNFDTNDPAGTVTNVVVVQPPDVAAGQTNRISGLSGHLDSRALHSAGNWAATALPKVGSWLLAQLGRVASWFGALIALALIPIYTYYLLSEKRGIQSHWTDYLPVAKSNIKDEIVFVLESANKYMIAFFRGQVLVAICDGVMYAIGFLIIGLPYAVLLGAVAVVLTLIPFLGAIVTCAAALLLALVQYGDWLHPMLVLVVFAVVQSIEGFVVAPKILGDKVGLHPLTIIIAVMAGTTLLGGILGGILAIPLTALLRVLLARYVWKRRIEAP